MPGTYLGGPAAKPLMFLLPAGIEWSAQFCADPAKVERLRLAAEALVASFPLTEDWYTADLGMSPHELAILHAPITDATGVAAWTDSFWNASVPLPQSMHTGMPPKVAPGYHHAPKPIVDIRTFVRDDFVLFPTPGVAVLPLSEYGSGDGRVKVAWVDHEVHTEHLLTAMPYKSAQDLESAVLEEGDVLPASHPVARAAYVNQQGDQQ